MRSRVSTLKATKILSRKATFIQSNASLSTITVLRAAQPATKPPETLVQPRASGITPSDKNYPPKVLSLADEILKLTLLEISDLNEIIRNRLGIQNIAYAAPVGISLSIIYFIIKAS